MLEELPERPIEKRGNQTQEEIHLGDKDPRLELARLAQRAREEEKARVDRNRNFVAFIVSLICVTFLLSQIIEGIWAGARYIIRYKEESVAAAKERGKIERENAEKKLKERVAIAAREKAMTLDELRESTIYSDGCKNAKPEEFFDESRIIRFVDDYDYGKAWLVHLNDEGFDFCKLYSDREITDIVYLWRTKKR